MSEPQPITIHAARRGEETEELYVELAGGMFWRLELVGELYELPEPTVPVRLTADPDRDAVLAKATEALRARIAYLENELDEEKDAAGSLVKSLREQLAKCRENFAEHTNAEFPAEPAGRCGTRTPQSVSSVSLACQLVAGHMGWHKSGTCEWGEPVELEAVRVGLDVDQEIRARAARFWLDATDTRLRWSLEDWVAWIRDGGVPDA